MPVNTGRVQKEFNVALQPTGAKQLDSVETLAPAHLEIYNAVRTDAGFFKGRPGYTQAFDLGLGAGWSIPMLIPASRATTSFDGSGFAFAYNLGSASFRVFELLNSGSVREYTGPGTGVVQSKVSWTIFDGIPIWQNYNFQGLHRIRTDNLAGTNVYDKIATAPTAYYFVDMVADRLVVSGGGSLPEQIRFEWSDPGSATVWPGAANRSQVTGAGESIRWMKVLGTDLYFFKDFSIEIWGHIGGREVFGRKGIIPLVDKFARHRRLIGESVVLAGDPPRFFFYCDNDFWVLDGFAPRRISGAYKARCQTLSQTFINDAAYFGGAVPGFDYAKEHVIRWRVRGVGVFVYDYLNDVWTEDAAVNVLSDTMTASIPAHGRSYMEFGTKAYVTVGDPIISNGTDKVYEWTNTAYQDAGSPFTVFRRLRFPLDPQQNHRCRWNRLLLRGKRGRGAASSNPQLTVRWWLDQDADSYTGATGAKGKVTLPLGETGDADFYFPAITGLGVGRDVTLELEHAANVPHVLTHATIAAKPLGR